MQTCSRIIGCERERGGEVKYQGKAPAPPGEAPLILRGWNADAVEGIFGVAVKCIDIAQNTDCEGS